MWSTPALLAGPDGHTLLCWRAAEPVRAISSAPVGGGIGEAHWVLNAGVADGYHRTDLAEHLAELAGFAGCAGRGVGMLTAARVERYRASVEAGAMAVATVGVSWPTWAADCDGAFADFRPPGERGIPPLPGRPTAAQEGPGTINLVVHVPVALSDAALVNAVATATEAKTQALLEAGVPGTGTATDAVCVVCPAVGPAEPFGGPRSRWGARLARVVHAAVSAGLEPAS